MKNGGGLLIALGLGGLAYWLYNKKPAPAPAQTAASTRTSIGSTSPYADAGAGIGSNSGMFSLGGDPGGTIVLPNNSTVQTPAIFPTSGGFATIGDILTGSYQDFAIPEFRPLAGGAGGAGGSY